MGVRGGGAVMTLEQRNVAIRRVGSVCKSAIAQCKYHYTFQAEVYHTGLVRDQCPVSVQFSDRCIRVCRKSGERYDHNSAPQRDRYSRKAVLWFVNMDGLS